MVVMVVDDQEMQLYLVGCQLSSAGHSVIGCGSGEEALDRLNSKDVDMVITDMEMGVMSGEHVRQHVREHFGSLPVILMSGNPENLRREGFDGYLAKPFSMRELLAAVERHRK
jgi:CheY-like chemotaxis protein